MNLIVKGYQLMYDNCNYIICFSKADVTFMLEYV